MYWQWSHISLKGNWLLTVNGKHLWLCQEIVRDTRNKTKRCLHLWHMHRYCAKLAHPKLSKTLLIRHELGMNRQLGCLWICCRRFKEIGFMSHETSFLKKSFHWNSSSLIDYFSQQKYKLKSVSANWHIMGKNKIDHKRLFSVKHVIFFRQHTYNGLSW